MRSRDITLWLDERWYDALSKYLKGETLEEHLQNTIDEMCRQLPGQEYDRINEEIQQEQKDDQIAQEAARRFAVFHVTEGSSSTYFLTEERLEFLQTARQLRNYIRKADGDAPAHFAEMFPRRENLSRKQFQKYVSERLDNTGRVVGAFDIDLDTPPCLPLWIRQWPPECLRWSCTASWALWSALVRKKAPLSQLPNT